MTTLSAGLINVENLTVTGTQSGAVQASNFNFTNLGLSGNLSVGGNLTAPNLTSNVPIANDRWHLPTPTGPFAVDIIPCAAKDMFTKRDLFGFQSNKFWGTMEVLDDVYVTIWAPSNRTGAAKNVSASLTGCMDPNDPTKTLAFGTLLYHPDDFVFTSGMSQANIPNAVGADPAYVEAVTDFINTFKATSGYGGSDTIDSDPAVRADLIDKWAVIEGTTTYENLYQHFSVATGKIWHIPQGTDLGDGYKDFTSATTANQYVSGTNIYATTWTTAQLPTQQQIFDATGDDDGCPVVLKIGGYANTDIGYTDPWHCAELASRGFIVITMASPPSFAPTFIKTGTNQTIIDCIRNGYIGDNTNFDPTKLAGLANYATRRSVDAFSYGNYNDPSSFDYYGNPGENLFPIQYTDTNGRSVPEVPFLSTSDQVTAAYFGFQSCISHTSTGPIIYIDTSGTITNPDTSGTTTYNSVVTMEKFLFMMKYFATRISGFESRIDFTNCGIHMNSFGGLTYSAAQLISDNNGYTRCLGSSGEQPGEGVFMFKLNHSTMLNCQLLQAKEENLGYLLENLSSPSGNPIYAYPNSFAVNNGSLMTTNDNFCPLPSGLTVPVLGIFPTGPAIINFAGLDLDIQTFTNFFQYYLQKTRVSNSQNPYADGATENIVAKSFIYSVGVYHGDAPTAESTNEHQQACYPSYLKNWMGGWDWPQVNAFNNILQTNGELPTLQTQQLLSDINRVPMTVMWDLHNQIYAEPPLAETEGVSIQQVIEYGNRGSGIITMGPNYLDSSLHLDAFFRYIGPHKFETLLDPANNYNHLSIDFGKNILYEDNDNVIHITPLPNTTPSVTGGLVLDGSGSYLQIGNTQISESQLIALLALL